MNIFLSALNAMVPHFKVSGHKLLLSQEHPFIRTEVDLRLVAAHKIPGMTKLHLRLFRGRWEQYSLQGYRPQEISNLCALLSNWERENHRKHRISV